MLKRTASILDKKLEFLPLKSAAHIEGGNALTRNWNEIVPDGVDYIISNPPFIGKTFRTKEQQAEMSGVFTDVKGNGNLDYVACWFKKAADFMIGTQTRAAFVSTNSITQGEQVAPLWKVLDAHIDFAYRTFKWQSDSEDPAAVHCVIVGFSHAPNPKPRIIFDDGIKIIAKNINAYLLDAPDLIVGRRAEPICDVPPMNKGSQPTDGGHLLLSPDERDELLRREPRAERFIRRFVGAEEYINGKARYCLWLKDATADDLKMPAIAERVEAVREFRLSSRKAATRVRASTPHLFTEIRQPTTNYLLVPRVSGERRRYIPIGFMSPNVIAGDAASVVPNADLFIFGVLESSVHMAWMRVVCGRLEMRYSYSNTIVYNNFPWCARTSMIEKTAARILEVRAKFGDRSLASLYDEATMPGELRAAHQENDNAVLDAYGFARDMSELEIVSRLMEMYSALTQKNS